MKTLNVYLSFAGQCQEALNFYAKVLGGKIISLQKFGDSSMPSDEDKKN
ncbi:hypothetical protein [Rubrolithibacter danxiaensis]